MKLLLHPDKRKINGPKVDNGFTVSFDIGEHEREIVGELIAESVETPTVVIILTGKDAEEAIYGS